MLCSQFQMRRQVQDYEEVAILPCRSWRCDYCAPRRRSQLKAMAASGLPNSCLTLTIKLEPGRSPAEQYVRLHSAWKVLVKRILRQFAKPPEQRWELHSDDGGEYYEISSFRITSQVKAKTVKRLHYMAFCEATEAGEPHLHILLRTKYIPQRWLSEQMKELVNSPIVWIEKVKGAKSAIAYVTKYVTDAPAQFGKSRRYWTSRFYRLRTKDKTDRPLLDRRNARRIRQQFQDLILEILQHGLIPIPQPTEEVRLYKPRDAWRLYSDGNNWRKCWELDKASHWLAYWRRQAGFGPHDNG